MRMCLCGCGRVLYALNPRRQYHPACLAAKRNALAQAARIEALFQAARRARLLRRAA